MVFGKFFIGLSRAPYRIFKRLRVLRLTDCVYLVHNVYYRFVVSKSFKHVFGEYFLLIVGKSVIRISRVFDLSSEFFRIFGFSDCVNFVHNVYYRFVIRKSFKHVFGEYFLLVIGKSIIRISRVFDLFSEICRIFGSSDCVNFVHNVYYRFVIRKSFKHVFGEYCLLVIGKSIIRISRVFDLFSEICRIFGFSDCINFVHYVYYRFIVSKNFKHVFGEYSLLVFGKGVVKFSCAFRFAPERFGVFGCSDCVDFRFGYGNYRRA